jgi:uncharacterized protein (DUF58 family)
MSLGAGKADEKLLSAPLLDRAELVALIRLGEHLARGLPSRPSERGRHGGEPARRTGEGLDFAEHRPYQPGDEPRSINWRLTARHGEAQVRLYHQEFTAPCVILLDRRATMRFGTRRRLKVAQAVRLAMVLAGLYAARQADITVLEVDSRDHLLPATDGRGLLPLGQHLAAPCPPHQAEEPALGEALNELYRRIPAGARLILLSDFADADPIDIAQWHRLARRYELAAVCLEDPAEIALPLTGGGASLCWQGPRRLAVNPRLGRRLAEAHGQRIAALQEDLAGCGVRLQRLRTDQDDLAPILESLLR